MLTHRARIYEREPQNRRQGESLEKKMTFKAETDRNQQAVDVLKQTGDKMLGLMGENEYSWTGAEAMWNRTKTTMHTFVS